MEAFNLTEMTIVTFSNNGKKLNFLLDTGSNDSYISKSTSELDIVYKELNNNEREILGSAGASQTGKEINMDLTYKDFIYNNNMYVLDSLDESFKSIKETDGVQLHGILGTIFLNKYRFILDFDELVAYKK